jgi:hypothetical protein
MRQETIVKTYLSYDELTEEQKLKVLEKLSDINVDWEYWHEGVTDDFKHVLELLGYSDIETFFTGFWSQGDGASFSATFSIPQNAEELQQRIDALKEHVPTFFENTSLDEDFLALDFKEELQDGETNIKVARIGHYYHECSMYCDNDGLQEFSRYLAARYYRDLEKTHDYLTSREAIEESIESNGYEFDIDTLTIA